MIGIVLDVDTVTAGGTLAISAAAGALELVLVDAADFAEDGGYLALDDGQVFDYDTADLDTDIVTLAAPLPVPLDEGDQVQVHPLVPTKIATVSVDDDEDTLQCRVPHTLVSMLRSGVRDDEADREAVTVDLVDGEWTVTDVHGEQPIQIFGDPDGKAVELWADSVRFFDLNADGIRAESSRLGGDGPDALAFFDDLGEVVAGIVDGVVTGRSAQFDDDILVRGVPLVGTVSDEGAVEGWLDRASAGGIARKPFGTVSRARPTLEEWGYAAIGGTLRAGRLYRVSASVAARANVTGGAVVCRLRLGEGGPAGLLSTEIARVDLGQATSPTHTPSGYCQGYVSVPVDTDVDLLVTYQGVGGATPQMYSAELAITDESSQGGYTGGSYRPIGPESTTMPDPEPAPTTSTVREYVGQWRAIDSATYSQDGERRTDAKGDAIQGRTPYATFWGHQQAAIVFGGGAYLGHPLLRGLTLDQARAGGTVVKAEAWLENRSWHRSSGGTALLGKLGSSSTTVPKTLSATASLTSAGWPVGRGRWVRLPTHWFSDNNRGITLGGGSLSSDLYYGRFWGHASAAPPILRLTIER